MSDGIYFLDSRRGDQQKSTLGFYNNLVPGGNNNEFPQSISDVTSINQGFQFWETGTEASHTFDTGVTLKWTIAVDAASRPNGSDVGEANNGFQFFIIFKDDDRNLFTTADGFNCQTLYFARA